MIMNKFAMWLMNFEFGRLDYGTWVQPGTLVMGADMKLFWTDKEIYCTSLVSVSYEPFR